MNEALTSHFSLSLRFFFVVSFQIFIFFCFVGFISSIPHCEDAYTGFACQRQCPDTLFWWYCSDAMGLGTVCTGLRLPMWAWACCLSFSFERQGSASRWLQKFKVLWFKRNELSVFVCTFSCCDISNDNNNNYSSCLFVFVCVSRRGKRTALSRNDEHTKHHHNIDCALLRVHV